jgi:hypothetical protein
LDFKYDIGEIMANVTLNAGVVYYGGWWGPINDGMLIPPDSVIRIEPNWINNGAIPVTGHLTMTARYTGEENTPVECIYGQDKTLGPGESTNPNNPYFEDMLLREGICAFEISLTIDGVDAGKQNFAIIVSNTLSPNQIRVPLENSESPLALTINTTDVYGHVGAYIYRILPEPIDIDVTFHADGVSYVEILDCDTVIDHKPRWLLPEKTPINGDQTFTIPWDGRGVLEPRVWLESNTVTGITLEWELPEGQIIPFIEPNFNLSPIILGLGIAGGSMLALNKRKKNVQ